VVSLSHAFDAGLFAAPAKLPIHGQTSVADWFKAVTQNTTAQKKVQGGCVIKILELLINHAQMATLEFSKGNIIFSQQQFREALIGKAIIHMIYNTDNLGMDIKRTWKLLMTFLSVKNCSGKYYVKKR